MRGGEKPKRKRKKGCYKKTKPDTGLRPSALFALDKIRGLKEDRKDIGGKLESKGRAVGNKRERLAADLRPLDLT